jgi:hypothetical protein
MPTGPQRLILIRSGCYEYADIELSGALQIVGPNNTGKTALINALQFLYLDDRRHMDFGPYTAEQTREFYFLNQYSYILFECLGATGKCVIGWRGQSKASGGEPERFFHVGPFDPSDFLDERNQVREPRDVSARLALKRFRSIKSAQEHKELLLPTVNGDGVGIGVVALRDSDKYHRFRETLKNLLALSAISQEQMRDRLLMLADIPPDRAAFDTRELFGDDYDRIRNRREQLLKFKKNQELVEKLVGRFAERETVRGELVWRWTDLRAKCKYFDKDNKESLAKLLEALAEQDKKIQKLETELAERRKDSVTFSQQKGQLLAPLQTIEAQDSEFKEFLEDFERAALNNLKQEIRGLELQLAGAEGVSRGRAKRTFDALADRVRQKREALARFDHLAVTALRQHFTDEELNTIFRLLNRDLLEIPVGEGGVTTSRQDELLRRLRDLRAHVRKGVYRDSVVSFPLPNTGEPLSGLENANTARDQLLEYETDLKRWERILAAIEQREQLESQCKVKRGEAEALEKGLFRFEEYQKAKADEARLRAELKKVEASIATTNENISELGSRLKLAEKTKSEVESATRKHQDDSDKVFSAFEQCIFPDFSTQALAAEDNPGDFAASIALFLKQQDKQGKLTDEVASLIMKTELCFGDVFRGANEYETTAALQGELEALVEKEEALARDWNAHIHGLKATFDHVLKNLDDVRSAAAKINRAFAKIQVSNLKAVKLEVVEQSDLVSWVKRLAAFEPGGLFDADPQQESAIANFRRKIQDNPVIRFTNLFTLSFTVIGADDQRHTYHDFRQIESHGTTITLKVLFNLLLLKDQLRRDDCAVPFFLDEIQTLDPANRRAILRTAKQLGFIAITAAPEAVSDVDALYFLQPQNGRIVVRNKHRVTVKRAVPVED